MRAGLRAPAGAAARARAALALGAGTHARARSTLAASLHDDEREALRSSAARANAELDPRGVDYDLFEPPTSEYLREAQHATIPSVLSAPVALLHRLLHAARSSGWSVSRVGAPRRGPWTLAVRASAT